MEGGLPYSRELWKSITLVYPSSRSNKHWTVHCQNWRRSMSSSPPLYSSPKEYGSHIKESKWADIKKHPRPQTPAWKSSDLKSFAVVSGCALPYGHWVWKLHCRIHVLFLYPNRHRRRHKQQLDSKQSCWKNEYLNIQLPFLKIALQFWKHIFT